MRSAETWCPASSFRQEEEKELCHRAVAWNELLSQRFSLAEFCTLLELFCLSQAGHLCSALLEMCRLCGKEAELEIRFFGSPWGIGESKLLSFSWDPVLENSL